MNENSSIKQFNEFVFGFFPKEGIGFIFFFYSKLSTPLKVELLTCSPFLPSKIHFRQQFDTLAHTCFISDILFIRSPGINLLPGKAD